MTDDQTAPGQAEAGPATDDQAPDEGQDHDDLGAEHWKAEARRYEKEAKAHQQTYRNAQRQLAALRAAEQETDEDRQRRIATARAAGYAEGRVAGLREIAPMRAADALARVLVERGYRHDHAEELAQSVTEGFRADALTLDGITLDYGAIRDVAEALPEPSPQRLQPRDFGQGGGPGTGRGPVPQRPADPIRILLGGR